MRKILKYFIYIFFFLFFFFCFFDLHVLAETFNKVSFEEIANSPTLEHFQSAYRQLSWFDKDRLINFMIEKSSFFTEEDRIFLNEKYNELVRNNKNIGYFGSPNRNEFLDFLYDYSYKRKFKSGLE